MKRDSSIHAACAAAAMGVLTSTCDRAPSSEAHSVRVAAASDLTGAFTELARAYERAGHPHVSLVFGASGVLSQQLAHGAPYDVFASANAGYVDAAVRAHVCDGTTKTRYARGRLAMWARSGSVRAPRDLADLASPRFVRIAIANPEHAPYGAAAKQALTNAQVWNAVEARLVITESVVQALQLARSGNAEVALVAHSLTIGEPNGVAIDVDPSLHAPLDQTLVVCEHGGNAAGGRDFARYVVSREGRAVFTRFGFLPPEPE